MTYGSHYLILSSRLQGEPVALVPAMDFARLQGVRGSTPLSVQEALRCYDSMDVGAERSLRAFVARARVAPSMLTDVGDLRIRALVRQAIISRAVVAVREGAATANSADGTALQRKLVKQLERCTGGRLTLAGREYRLVADLDLAKLRGRGSFEVVGHDQACQVLDEIGKAVPPEVATLLAQARSKLTANWRPPVTQPDGLILLRRARVVAAVSAPEQPVLMPSQLLAARKTSWITIRVEDHWHDHFGFGSSGTDIRRGCMLSMKTSRS